MVKIVDLCLDGDSENLGFTVRLTIAEEGSQADIQKSANLPASPELSTQLQDHWQEKYRTLGTPYRIKPKEITLKRSFKEQVQECNESADKLRKNLNTWLDYEEFRLLDKELRTSLNKDDEIRFLIRTDSQELHKLPWEEWEIFKSYPKAGFALSPTKYERIKTTTLTCNPKVRILAILGNSEGINIDTDRQLLQSLPNVETVFLVEKTYQEINDQLWEQSWDILFFAGHSETEGETGKIYINPTDSLSINELWFGLNKAVNNGLKIAIFNSCDGLGLARQLESMSLHIPQMIVMRELVPDRVAQEFLKYFLTAFSRGESFDLAVREAKERLKGMESDFPCASWLPVIWQNPAAVPPTWQDLFTETEPEIVESESVTLRPKRRLWKRSLQRLLIASVGITCLVMGMRWFGILQSLELYTFDKMMQLRGNESLDERLLIVEVTKEDTERWGYQNQLQAQTMLKLLQKLDESKPNVIGVSINRDEPVGKGRADLIQYLQQKQNKHIFTICSHPEGKEPGIKPPDGISEKLVGFVDVVKDSDGIVRRHLLSLKQNKSSCNANYSLSFQLANKYLESKGYSLSFPSWDNWKIGNLEFKIIKSNPGFYQDINRLDRLDGHQILLNYRYYNYSTAIAKPVTLTEVLNNKVSRDLVEGKIILIGITDKQLTKDEFNTPYSDNNHNKEIRGLILHAQMVSQFISAVENGRHLLWFLPLWGEIIWVLVWCLVGGILNWRFQILLYRRIAVVCGVIVFSGICFVCLLTNGVVLPLIPTAFALVATNGIVAIKPRINTRKQFQVFY
ncbi:MAG: CHASE2 domain-containing protein [Potamolinea sp.]